MNKRLMGVASTLLVTGLVLSGIVWGNGQANIVESRAQDVLIRENLTKPVPTVHPVEKQSVAPQTKPEPVSRPVIVKKVVPGKPVAVKPAPKKEAKPNVQSKCMYPMRKLGPDGSCNNEDPCDPERIKVDGGQCVD